MSTREVARGDPDLDVSQEMVETRTVDNKAQYGFLGLWFKLAYKNRLDNAFIMFRIAC